MTRVRDLVTRNAVFAAGHSFADLRINPAGDLMVIGCVDPRVDPSLVLGLALGEAAVIRNVGGRVTPQTLNTLDLLAKVGQANSDGRPRGEWNLVILHHTDCGMTDLAAFPDLLGAYFEVAETDLAAKAVSDPVRSVEVDVEVVRSHINGGSDFLISGLVYDVATGEINVVVAPTPLSEPV